MKAKEVYNYKCTLVKVVDGDTIHINKTKYRLHGIDAPEINQKCKVKFIQFEIN